MPWDEVCKTAEKGGLGIRKLDQIAKTAAIKLVWTFLQGESIWAK